MQKFNKIESLSLLMEKYARFARPSIDRAILEFGEPWQVDFEVMLKFVYSLDESMQHAVKGYSSFVMDSMRRQKRFETERSYPAKSYAEAAAEVYLNDEYMDRLYLPGLLLSHYLWPHHYQQIKYFREFFLSVLHSRGVTDFAEVGVGTGVYSRVMLETLPEVRGEGFDISPISLKFTERHVAAYGIADRYHVEMRDILSSPLERKFQSLICVEVLEHLEDPVALIKGLKAMLLPGGYLFLTAALNAANADHIYLYRSPGDLMAQVDDVGLHVENLFLANAYAPNKPGVPVPAALAMVLRS